MLNRMKEGVRSVYRIAVLAEQEAERQRYAEQITRFCEAKGLFPQVMQYDDQERFFETSQKDAPTNAVIALSSVANGLQLAAVRRNRCMLFAYYSGRQYGCNAVPILNIGILNSFIHSRRVQMPEFSPTISIFSLQKTASIS